MSGVVLPLDEPELSFFDGGTLVRRSVHASGVRILTEHVPGAESATVGFWLPAGSRDEDGVVLGSTHFLEHLLFKGTPSRSALDIAVAFDAVGGDHNAVTAKEYTCYYAKVRTRDLPMAVEVLSDMVAASELDAKEFETERGVILEELAMAEDDPADVINERFFEAVLSDHPLGRPIGGTPETIESATREAVQEHYRATYRPSRLVVSAAGNVDHDELVRRVTEGLTRAGWDLGVPTAPEPRRVRAEASLQPGRELVVVSRPTEQTHLLVGMPGLIAGDERRATLAVLSSILGGGMSSRLFQEIREKRGLAYSVYAFAAAFSDAGVVGLSAATAADNAGTVARLLLDEFERLAAAGVTQEEVTRAVGYLSGSSALALEDSDVRMSRLGRAEIGTGEFVAFDEQVRRYEAVDRNMVQDLAQDLLSRPLTVAALGAVDPESLAGLAGPASARAAVAHA